MKRTQIVDLFANIKATFVSFLSILMFVALGVAVFLGISWAAPALQNAADNMFDKGSFHNFQIQYSYGLTDNDLEKLAELESVSQVEAEHQSFEKLRIDLSADGAWVTQAYAEHFGVGVGDVITVDDGDGAKHEVPILGFYEFWLTYNEMVMGKDYFEKEFGHATPNAVLAQTGDIAFADLEAALANIEGFDSIIDDATRQEGDFDTFSSVSGAVVFIYLVLATLMAIVVLLNLNVMFIDEKKREIIVLMINGFSVKDARHYVSYDNVALTAIGIIVGLVLGCIMGSVTVASVEPVTGVFVKSVDGWAVAIGILGSIALAVIMALIALRRINRFKLTDINKF